LDTRRIPGLAAAEAAEPKQFAAVPKYASCEYQQIEPVSIANSESDCRMISNETTNPTYSLSRKPRRLLDDDDDDDETHHHHHNFL
jgi:hypothetical protein